MPIKTDKNDITKMQVNATEEVYPFLLKHNTRVDSAAFDESSCDMRRRFYENLKVYIDQNYVDENFATEYEGYTPARPSYGMIRESTAVYGIKASMPVPAVDIYDEAFMKALDQRIEHLSDTFPEYLRYIIEKKGFSNAEVYKRALVSKQSFAKIMNNPNHCPKKITVLCLAVGACLNLDETKDLLSRAGYALSPCNKADIIFSYFIENQIYDILEIDIALEEYGLPCLVS